MPIWHSVKFGFSTKLPFGAAGLFFSFAAPLHIFCCEQPVPSLDGVGSGFAERRFFHKEG
jgi:hypothetical protein